MEKLKRHKLILKYLEDEIRVKDTSYRGYGNRFQHPHFRESFYELNKKIIQDIRKMKFSIV
ncbi:MAG: hypothetical protein J7J73_00340 [Deltaproteobacteria bacterium]|nr:hypothetical protein [Deltaproteobacteria bacterium]